MPTPLVSRSQGSSDLSRWFAPTIAALVCVLTGLLLATPAVVSGQGDTPAAAPAAHSHVTLIVEYADGIEKRWTKLDWKPGMTVAQALSVADNMPAPMGLNAVTRGEGERYFVEQIDGLENQGGGKADPNWLFFVNGQMAKKSAGVIAVAAGDTITWRYIPFDWSKAP